MPASVGERLRALRAHHVNHMPEERKFLLVARCCGVVPKRLAELRHRSVSAVKRDLDLARAAIFDPTGLDRDCCLAKWWVAEHGAWCVQDPGRSEGGGGSNAQSMCIHTRREERKRSGANKSSSAVTAVTIHGSQTPASSIGTHTGRVTMAPKA